jgi:hypothetical protein
MSSAHRAPKGMDDIRSRQTAATRHHAGAGVAKGAPRPRSPDRAQTILTRRGFARASLILAIGSVVVVFASEGDASPPVSRPAVQTLPPGCGPTGTKFQCNPLTNAGCDRAKGESCDDDDHGGFGCYPGPNTGKEGAKCDDKVGCNAGFGCDTDDDDDDEGECARFCCTNADCGSKKCTVRDKAFGSLGFCE